MIYNEQVNKPEVVQLMLLRPMILLSGQGIYGRKVGTWVYYKLWYWCGVLLLSFGGLSCNRFPLTWLICFQTFSGGYVSSCRSLRGESLSRIGGDAAVAESLAVYSGLLIGWQRESYRYVCPSVGFQCKIVSMNILQQCPENLYLAQTG